MAKFSRFAALAVLFCALPSFAQDVRVNCARNPTCVLTPSGGIPWANGNLTFIFTPLQPHVSVYIYIHNNNTTNAHTSQTISVYQSPFLSGLAPSLSVNSSRWVQDAVTQNSVSGASCNNVNANNDVSPGASGLGSCFVMSTFAAQVAIKITGAAAQAGSNDTFDLSIIQEPSQMGGGAPGSPTGVDPCSAGYTKLTGFASLATTTQTLLVQGVSGKGLYLCSAHLFLASGTQANELVLMYGVGSGNCGGTTTNFFADETGASQTSYLTDSWGSGSGTLVQVPAGSSLCVQGVSTGSITGFVTVTAVQL